jgi:hypothetical protein
MPTDLHLLFMSLEAIECVCTHEKAKSESSEKTSHKGEKGKNHPGTKSMARVPKKVCFEKHCNLCKRHGGAYTTHNTKDCHRYEKGETKKKSKFRTAKKGSKKANLVNQNLAQLSEKLDKLKKALKKPSKKRKMHRYKDSNFDSV